MPGSKLGVVVLGSDIATVADLARRAERRGLDSVWTAEFYDRSAVVTLAAMANATSEITVGSAIAYGVGRSPLVLSAEARDIDEICGGRFVLGLGVGTKRMQADWHGAIPEAPAVRVEELVPLLRRFWAMDEAGVQHDGRFYHVALKPTAEIHPPLRAEIPIYVAGVNSRMVQAAGAVAEGLVGHPLFTADYVEEVVRPALAKGERLAERATGSTVIAGYAICAIDEDGDLARREAKGQIAFYSLVKTYRPILAMHGLESAGDAVRAAWEANDFEGMIDAVPDRLLELVALAGTPDEVSDQYRAHIDGRYEHVLLYPPNYRVGPDRFARNLDAILDTFARS